MIFAQWAPRVLTMAGCRSWRHVQLPSSWCVGQCCVPWPPLKPWLGVEVPLLTPGGAAGPWVSSPPDAHQRSPSSSVAAAWLGGDEVGRWDPLWALSVHLRHEKAALHSDISYALGQVPAQAWAPALSFAA